MPPREVVAERRVKMSEREEFVAVLERGKLGCMARLVVEVRPAGSNPEDIRETDTLDVPAPSLRLVARALEELARASDTPLVSALP